MNDLEVMTKARELFERKGGAQGQGVDRDGRLCAVITISRIDPFYSNRLGTLLDEVASELFGMGIVVTNDRLGKTAILQVFDKVIARLEEEI